MNPFQLMQQFNQFKKNFERNHAGQNPQAMVQELLNSGKMTQQQFETFRQMANRLTGMKM